MRRRGENWKVNVKFVGPEEPILAVAATMEIQPVLWTESQEDFLGDITGERKPEANGMFQAFLKSSHGPLKIARGKVLLVRGGADGFAIKFDGSAGGRG